MHAAVRLCWRNLHSSPRVRNNSHYQQSLLEHTEAEFATGHITTIESGTCKDGKWEEERKREGEREGGKEKKRASAREGGREIHWQKWNNRESKSVGQLGSRTKEKQKNGGRGLWFSGRVNALVCECNNGRQHHICILQQREDLHCNPFFPSHTLLVLEVQTCP